MTTPEDPPFDKQFKDRLNQDQPVFKEEYWQQFEKLLPQMPPASPAPASGVAKTSVFSGISGIVKTYGYAKVLLVLASVLTVGFVSWFLISSPEPVLVKNTPSSIATNTESTQTQAETYPTKAQTPSSKVVNPAEPLQQISSYTPEPTNSNQTKTAKGFVHVTKPVKLSPSAQKSQSKPAPKPIGQEAGAAIPSSLTPKTTETITTLVETKDPTDEPVQQESTIATEKPADTTGLLQRDPEITKVEENNAGSKAKAPIPLFDDKPLRPVMFYLVPGMSSYKTLCNSPGFNPVSRWAFQFGGAAVIRLSSSLHLWAEVNYIRTNGHSLLSQSRSKDLLFYTWNTLYKLENRELQFLRFPLLVKYSYKKHSVAAGPVFSYLLKTSGELTLADSTPLLVNFSHEKADNYLAGFQRFQTGLALEYAFEFYRQYALVFRYSFDLNSLTKTDVYPSVSNTRQKYLLLGLKFRIY